MSVLRDICELKIWYMTLLIYIYIYIYIYIPQQLTNIPLY
jgi:hypothetical protein